jgi:hypothetical protein
MFLRFAECRKGETVSMPGAERRRLSTLSRNISGMGPKVRGIGCNGTSLIGRARSCPDAGAETLVAGRIELGLAAIVVDLPHFALLSINATAVSV